MLSKVLGRKKGYLIVIKMFSWGFYYTGSEKEAQILYQSSSGSPLSVMFLMTWLKQTHMAPQTIFIS
jgi:hypothetical protein